MPRIACLLSICIAASCSAQPKGAQVDPISSRPDGFRSWTWSTASEMHAPRMMPARARLPGDRVLVVGGFTQDGFVSGNTAEVYDRKSNTWSYADPVPRRSAGAAALAVALPDGDVLYFGGFGHGLPDAESVTPEERLTFLFESKTGHWRTLEAKLPVSLYAAPNSSCVLGSDRIVCAGGVSDDVFGYTGPGKRGSAVSIVFDLASQRWSRAGSDLNQARDGATLIPLDDGKVFISGGRQIVFTPDHHDLYLASTEIYSPESGRWTLGPSMPIVPEEDGPGCTDRRQGPCVTDAPGSRWGHIAHKLQDGRVLIAGGVFGSDAAPARWGVRKSAFLFDAKNLSAPWRRIADLPAPRTMSLSTQLPESDRLLIAGGEGAALDSPNPDCVGNSLDLASALLFDPGTERWSELPAMPTTDLEQKFLSDCKFTSALTERTQGAVSTYNNQRGGMLFDDGALFYSGGFANAANATNPFSARAVYFGPQAVNR